MIKIVWFSAVKQPVDNWAKGSNIANIVIAACTFAAFIFLAIEFSKNRRSEKRTQEMEEHRFWHDHLPVLTLASPCDVTQNYCDINIANNVAVIEERGNELFSIVNFSSCTAFDVSIEISANENFTNVNSRYAHYYSEVHPYSPARFSLGSFSKYVYEEKDEREGEPVASEKTYTQRHVASYVPTYSEADDNIVYIYSKFFIDPATKSIANSEFDICSFTSDCQTQPGCEDKCLFIRLTYFSSPNAKVRKRVISTFKVTLICSGSQASKQASDIRIKNIDRTEYQLSEDTQK